MNIIINEGWAGSGVHRQALRELRRPVGGRAEIHARCGQRDHRRSRGQAHEAAEHLRSARRARASSTPWASPSTPPGRPTSSNLANLAMITGHVGVAARRGQPAARPEQRAGRLRHGRAAQRLLRLPVGHQARERGRLREGLGRGARARARAAHPGDVRRHRRPATSRPCTSWARTRCSPTPTPTTCARPSPRSTSWSSRTSS